MDSNQNYVDTPEPCYLCGLEAAAPVVWAPEAAEAELVKLPRVPGFKPLVLVQLCTNCAAAPAVYARIRAHVMRVMQRGGSFELEVVSVGLPPWKVVK